MNEYYKIQEWARQFPAWHIFQKAWREQMDRFDYL